MEHEDTVKELEDKLSYIEGVEKKEAEVKKQEEDEETMKDRIF